MAGGKMDDYEKLKYVALGLWGLSLCLPGYQTTGAVGTWYGGMILLLAPIAFLQPLASLALYANIPFWLALILRDGKASIILMWLMVIPLFFMDSIAEPDFFSPSFYEYFTLDARYPIIAWGWGAVLWLLSFFVLTYARLLRDKPDSKNRARHLGWRCAALLILCAALHLWQFSQLNDAQKAWLGWGMAFATANIDMPPSHNPVPGY